MEYKQRFSNSLDMLKVVMSYFVICIHFSLPASDPGYMAFESYSHRVIAACAVPVFFIISGYLFFIHLEKNNWNWKIYLGKLQRRFHTLFIPYIGWILLSLTIVMLANIRIGASNIEWLQNHGWLRIFWNSECAPSTFNGIFGPIPGNQTPLLAHMWYIRDLIVMVIFSPVLYFIFKYLGRCSLLLLLLFFVGKFTDIYPGLTGSAWFFFGLGGFLSFENRRLFVDSKCLLYGSCTLCIVFATVLWKLPTTNIFYVHIRTIFCIVGVVTSMQLAWILAGKFSMPKCLTTSTMFIYCFHPFVINLLVDPIIRNITLWNNLHACYIFCILIPITIQFTCVVIYIIYKRILSLISRLY